MAKRKIDIEGIEIRLNENPDGDYICLTDMARKFNSVPNDLLKAWMRNAVNIDFLKDWEMLYNSVNFKTVGYDRIRIRAGANTFTLSVKEWVSKTDAIGIYSKAGKYGGTFAHIDIAIQFATWLSPSFYLLIIKEFQRLKTEEAKRLNIEWNIRRELAKAHYPMLKEAVLQNLPTGKKKAGFYLADEANLINELVFGMTAQQWRKKYPHLNGNMRDHATVEQLLLVSDLQIVDSLLRTEILGKFANDLSIHFADSVAMQRVREIQDRAMK